MTRIIADWDIVKNTGSIPWPYRRADAQTKIAREMAVAPHRAGMQIFLRTDSAPVLVGNVGFGIWGDHIKIPEIGYWIARPYWGRGIATEAGEAALEIAFGALRIPELAAGHWVDNPVSGRVLQKLGFVATGATRMHPCAARGSTVESVEYLQTRERWLERRQAFRNAA